MIYNKLKEEFSFLDDTELNDESINQNPEPFELYLINNIQQMKYFLKKYRHYKKKQK